MKDLEFKIADQACEFDAIHALNYHTFVEEIPQHSPNPGRRLVDAFHAQNTYAICLAQGRLVGMLAGRAERPFSLDRKLADLDRLLPVHRKPMEVRLLAVASGYRSSAVMARLVAELAKRFGSSGHDLALISGTLRQVQLYRHMGFKPFGPQVGTPQAPYQPMYLDLSSYAELVVRLARIEQRHACHAGPTG